VNNDLVVLLKKVLSVNLVIAIIAIAITYFVAKNFTIFIAAGILVSFFSLVINAVFTQLFIGNTKNGNIGLYILSVIIRVFAIAVIGLIVYSYNKYNLIPYIIGYSLSLTGIGAYSAGYNNLSEGK
jgi:ATP synthase I chain.